MINWNIDWTQGSTQRNAIMLPLAVIAVTLIIVGDLSGGLAVLGLAQVIYSALGIAVSDTPVK